MSSLAPPTSRNAPCPCGSGKRFKDCHGAAQDDLTQWLRRARSELEARDFGAAEASLRQRLAANRRTLPLFDMTRYARDFEAAMLRIWAEHARAA